MIKSKVEGPQAQFTAGRTPQIKLGERPAALKFNCSQFLGLGVRPGRSQNQRPSKKAQFSGCNGGGEAVIPAEVKKIRSSGEEQTAAAQQHLFMQEDKMASWLQYPLDLSFDWDLYVDLLYSASPPPSLHPASVTNIASYRAAAEIRPPHMPPRPTIPILQRKLQTSSPLQNFVQLSRFFWARNELLLVP
ncbi:Basic helix-loop-helix transcription factor [Abeliophyllum distichum]|uniref:Basic helix-loop-helix transcription factor n=1 Tax=Abeliophyllum distichum TaxID=126358 RepID=A0ABD1V2W5_9LAMI